MRKFRAAVIALAILVPLLSAGPAAAESAVSQDLPRFRASDAPAVPPGEVSPLIVNGEAATSSRGLAALHIDGKFECTGSIIAPRWVLTAKHCVEGYRDQAMAVRVKSLRYGSGGGVVAVIEAESVVRSIHDIALVRLSRSANAEYVPLASAHPKIGTTNYVFGWGRTCPTCAASPTLKRATVTVTGISDAYSPMGTEIRVSPGNGAPCLGDSGGPMFKLVDGKRYQVGVVSWGSSTCTGSSYFASVPISRDWIRGVTGV